MTAQTPPYALQNASHSAALFRQAVSSVFGTSLPATLATGGGPGGVMGATDLKVTQNTTANMSVNVAGGQCWIPGSQVASQGLYYGLNSGTVNLAIAASSSSGTRTDIVVAQVKDKEYGGSTDEWVLAVVTGTVGSGTPTTPASSLLLATVLVPKNATTITTADITDERTRIRTGVYPFIAAYTPSLGPVSNTSSAPVTAGTFYLPSAAKVRYFVNMSLQIPSGHDQAFTFTQKISTGSMDFQGAKSIQWSSGSSLPGGMDFTVVGLKQLTAGTHSVGGEIVVGGGGPTVTISYTYFEIQAVDV